MKKIVTVYSLLIGTSMIILWALLFFSHQIIELNTEPIRILMHITGEIITASLLIIGSIAYTKNKKIGARVLLLAHGMLFYTAIVSPGYYAQLGNIPMVIMFAIITVFTSINIIYLILLKD